jgi:hypothetical protein
LQKPGLYKLEVGLQNLHADDEDGILALCLVGWERDEAAVAGEENGDQAIPFHTHDREGGPGQSLFRYPRTNDGLAIQILPYFNPVCRKCRSCGTRGIAGQGERQNAISVLKIHEKRLGLEHWQINGMYRGGCHFPIKFYTQNDSRRSADAAGEARDQSGNQAEEDGFILACG